MGIVNYDIAAFFIILLDFYLFFSRKRIITAQVIFFGILLIITLGSVVADIATVLMYLNFSFYPLWMHYLINCIYYFFQNSIPIVFVFFVLSLSTRYYQIKKITLLTFCFPWLAGLFIIFSTPWTGLAFSFTDDYHYVRGPWLIVFYILVLIYMGIGLVTLFRNHKDIPPHTQLGILVFLPFSIIPFVIQFFFHELFVQNLGVVISELFILLTIEDFRKITDPFSGLFNRQAFIMKFDMNTHKKRPFTLLLVTLDMIDFFKHVLEPHFFSLLIKNICHEISGLNHSRNLVFQTSVDKYILLFEDSTKIEKVQKQIIGLFEKPWLIQNHELYVSTRHCEIHIPDETADLQTIFQAQYKLGIPDQKKKTTSRFLSLNDLSLSTTGRQLDVAQAIRRALANSGFDVHFQPIISATTEIIVSAEALVRLHDAQLGWIGPDEFIPIAEQNGSIHRIGDFVLERSCSFLSELRKANHTLGFIEINLSVAQCIQFNLVEHIRSIMNRYLLCPTDLCFEITETAATQSPLLMKKNMDALVEAGFSIAIDDFGTGYSNICNLDEIPFHTIKLDRSLINGTQKTTSGKIGLKNLITTFLHMDMVLVAEGVETLDQLQMLQSAGVNYIQGYYYSKPLPSPEFMAFMDKKEKSCT